MASLTDLYPRPRRVTLGGRAFLVGELTVGDLVDLQGWLDSRWADPMEGLRDRLGGMEAEERRRALMAAHAAAEAGPAVWGEDPGREAFRTGEGILEIFRVALARHHPALDLEAVTAVAERTSPAEYDAMRRALFGVTPLAEAESWLRIDHGGGGTITLVQALMEVAEVYGWTLDDLRTLTRTQVRLARMGGKDVRGIVVQPGMNLKAMVAAQRAKYHGNGTGAG